MTARMNNAEAVMWAVDSDPLLRSDFVTITLLDGPPDADRLRASVERILTQFRPMRQRVVSSPLGLAPPAWADDSDFDLEYHLRRLSVAPPGARRQLLDLAAQLAAAPMDRSRPLWEMTLVEGLEEGRAALLVRLHHTLTDGVGGVKLFRSMFEREGAPPPASPEPRWVPDPLVWRHPEVFAPEHAPSGPMFDWPAEAAGRAWPLDKQTSPLSGMASALAYRLGRGVSAARKGLELAAGLPMRSTDDLRLFADKAGRTARSVADQVMVAGGALSPLLVGRSLARHFDTFSVDVTASRKAAQALGGGRNDFFVCGLTGALLAYHERMGSPCDALRLAVPISTRIGTGPTGGNHFAPARVIMPIGPKDPAERLAVTRRTLIDLAAEPGIDLADSLAGVASMLPPGLLVPALRAQARTVDFAASIVPGLRGRRVLAGSQVLSSWPMGPRIGCAANFTLLGCGDSLDMGVNLDPAAFTDPDAFMECLRDSFDNLLAASA